MIKSYLNYKKSSIGQWTESVRQMMQLCLRVLRGVFGAAWLSPEEAADKALCLFSYFWNGLFTGAVARVKECLVGLTWDLLEMLAYPIIRLYNMYVQYTNTIYLSDYTSSSF